MINVKAVPVYWSKIPNFNVIQIWNFVSLWSDSTGHWQDGSQILSNLIYCILLVFNLVKIKRYYKQNNNYYIKILGYPLKSCSSHTYTYKCIFVKNLEFWRIATSFLVVYRDWFLWSFIAYHYKVIRIQFTH